MSLALKKSKEFAPIIKVMCDADKIMVALSDGREISIPLAWSPKLLNADREARENALISVGGYGIHWPAVDEDISIKAFLEGI